MQRVARPEAAHRGQRLLIHDPPPRVDGYFAATRVGKKKLTAAVAPAAHMQFRQLALELGKKGEVLLIEAINDLFSKYGKPPVA